MKKIAKWRYQEGKVVDTSKGIERLLGEGLSISLYHSDGEYRLSFSPTVVKMEGLYVTEVGFPMDGMCFSVIKKRFHQNTATKLYNALSELIPSMGRSFPEDKDSIAQTLKSLTI